MASLNGFTLVQPNKIHTTLLPQITQTPYITSSLKPHKSFQSFIHEKLVGIVIGTVVFVGCVSITPAKAAAMPPQQTSISESLEEEDESGTHKGKGRRCGLALVMHKKREGPAVFVMLDKALKIAQREKRVIEERNIRILMAQMHVVKGQLEEGLNLFQNLMDEDPRDFRPYLCQGIIYSLRDQKKEAAENFEIYRALVPEEVSQKGFLDDVVLAAKMKPAEQLKKEFDSELSNQK